MADFGSDFKTHLKTITAVTDVVGAGTASRIYPDVPKHSMDLPAIIYTESGGGESYEHLGGSLGVGETVMWIDSYAATRAAANSLSTIVRTNLQGPVNAAWGDTYVSSVTVSKHRETDIKWTADKQAIKWWITRIILRIFHDEDT